MPGESELELISASSNPSPSLRLKLSQSLGYSVICSLEDTDKPTKVLVRNDTIPNVQSVPLPTDADRSDPTKRAELADKLWGLTEAA